MEEVEIELELNNLYRTGRLLIFPEQGEAILIRDLIETVGTLEDMYHTVIADEELFKIAWVYYKDTVADASKYWWVIADANKIHDPFDLTGYVGQQILIPNILNILLKI